MPGMLFTSLHRALGRPPSPLTFDFITDAIESGVTERADLDWKQALPGKGDTDEFAKDVAAMANTGGGLVVYGVAEDRATSAAARVEPVPGWGEPEERRLRAIVYSKVGPLIAGLAFYPLSRGESATVVAVEVPASADAPHLVQVTRESFQAPVRYGAATQYLTERALAEAYRARFEQDHRRRETLDEALVDVLRPAGQPGTVLLAAAAVPLQPRPSQADRLTRDSALDFESDFSENPYLDSPHGDTSRSLSVVPGLRRQSIRFGDGVIVEVHNSGTVGVAFPAPDHALAPDVGEEWVALLAARIVHAVGVVTKQFGVVGGYLLRAELVASHLPVRAEVRVALRPPGDGYRDPDGTRPRVQDQRPVEVTLAPDMDEAARLGAARALALDLLNAAGIDRIPPGILA